MFDVEDFEQIVKTSINETLKDGKSWDTTKVNGWSNTICQSILKGALGMNKRFKYLVTCNLMQKTGAGMCTSSVQNWDVKEDIAYKLQWENNTIHCIVVAYALKIFLLKTKRK